MLLFGAALNSLPPSYLETARLAGASTRQQLTGIVLPSIKGYILTNLLLISLWTFNDFGPFLLIGGGLGRRTEVLPVYLYYEAFRRDSLRLRRGDRRHHHGDQPRHRQLLPARRTEASECGALPRVAFAGFAPLIGMFFALPMLWLVFALFNSDATLAAKPSGHAGQLPRSLRRAHRRAKVVGDLGAARDRAVTIVLAVGAPAAYALSRIRFPGDTFLYLLLLLSSVVAGSAAILPLYLLMFELDLLDTYRGIWLALAGGLLPAAMFILKDFTDSIPRSYEESAGCSAPRRSRRCAISSCR